MPKFYIYRVAYQTSYGEKPLLINFDNVCGYVEKFVKCRYLSLFPANEKYEQIFERIKYLV